MACSLRSERAPAGPVVKLQSSRASPERFGICTCILGPLLQDCEAYKCSGEELNFSALKTSFLRSGVHTTGGVPRRLPLMRDDDTAAIRLPPGAKSISRTKGHRWYNHRGE
ncbi:hypothetical protein AGR13a_Lc80029 [Agrobacterium genomosp. 13 str. CFBP 6927]|uniref:Uncharacterized protein n=1 Tax=Agrobacterium genomosp. 13 str. CFBP 6927 TaxID=1183428 RepID=A0ABP2BR12_9HYPH|nr:hypothetical protein AGR13a_Lc80029 [Agrobacterium genomosp. 13 str. CFBP 6927]